MRIRLTLLFVLSPFAFYPAMGGAAVENRDISTAVMIDEDPRQFLTVEASGNRVAVSLLRDDMPGITITVGNAMFDDGDLARVRLCSACEPFVFVPVHDASSTYGAITGIVAWKDGQWNLAILPLQSPFVSDPDRNGISMLKDRLIEADGSVVEQAFGFHRGSVFALSEPERRETSYGDGPASLVEAGRKLIESIHPPVKVRHPYPHMKVTFDEPELADDLIELVEKILTVADSRDASALSAFLAEDFFLERDYGGLHELGSPFDIFLAAMRLDNVRDHAYRDAGWEALKAQLTYAGMRLHDARQDTFCTRAEPIFVDMQGAQGVFAATRTRYTREWYYVRGRYDVHGDPDTSSPVVGILDNELVFSLPDRFPEEQGEAEFWSRVLLPGGAVGFLEPFRIQSWLAESLCFAPDPSGEWKIAGFIGGGD